MASTSSGVSWSRKRYMSRRQVQKLSRRVGAAALGEAGHGALEGVAVQVGRRRQKDRVALALRRSAGGDGRDATVTGDFDADAVPPAGGGQGGLSPEKRISHAELPVSS